jgi:hypothetical protein
MSRCCGSKSVHFVYNDLIGHARQWICRTSSWPCDIMNFKCHWMECEHKCDRCTVERVVSMARASICSRLIFAVVMSVPATNGGSSCICTAERHILSSWSQSFAAPFIRLVRVRVRLSWDQLYEVYVSCWICYLCPGRFHGYRAFQILQCPTMVRWLCGSVPQYSRSNQDRLHQLFW